MGINQSEWCNVVAYEWTATAYGLGGKGDGDDARWRGMKRGVMRDGGAAGWRGAAGTRAKLGDMEGMAGRGW